MNQEVFCFWYGKDSTIPIIRMDHSGYVFEICYFYQNTFYQFTSYGCFKYTSKKELLSYEEYISIVGIVSNLIIYFVEDLDLKKKAQLFLKAHQELESQKQAYLESSFLEKKVYTYLFFKQ